MSRARECPIRILPNAIPSTSSPRRDTTAVFCLFVCLFVLFCFNLCARVVQSLYRLGRARILESSCGIQIHTLSA